MRLKHFAYSIFSLVIITCHLHSSDTIATSIGGNIKDISGSWSELFPWDNGKYIITAYSFARAVTARVSTINFKENRFSVRIYSPLSTNNSDDILYTGSYLISKDTLRLMPNHNFNSDDFLYHILDDTLKLNNIFESDSNGAMKFPLSHYIWDNSYMKTDGIFIRNL